MLKISIIIPVYNASAFIENAVNSALQFGEVIEILLIEDRSIDNSLEVCRKLAAENSKIKLFQHPDKGNHGAGASRNLGLEKASQEFIAFLDADDYYLPNRFEAEKELFKNGKIEGVFGAMGTEFLSEKGKKEFEEKFKNTTLTTVNHHAEGKDIFLGLIGIDDSFGHFFHLNGLTVKTESLRETQLKFNENLRVHQDSDFIIKLSYHCHLKSGIIDEAIAIRGVHDDNRITKIKPYSTKFYHNHLLLQKSIYQWSKTANLDKNAAKNIKLNYLSYKLANENGFQKYFNFFKICILNSEFFKMKYRYHALNKPKDA